MPSEREVPDPALGCSFAFTLRHSGRASELRSGVEVSEGFVPDFESNVPAPDLRFERCDAIWFSVPSRRRLDFEREAAV